MTLIFDKLRLLNKRSFIKNGIREGLSVTKTLNLYRNVGFKSGTSQFFKMAREIKDFATQTKSFKNISGKKRLKQTDFISRSRDRGQKYHYVFELNVFNPLIGRNETVVKTTASSKIITPENALKRLLDKMVTGDSEYDFKIKSTSLLYADKRQK